jgi:hypothetical protein
MGPGLYSLWRTASSFHLDSPAIRREQSIRSMGQRANLSGTFLCEPGFARTRFNKDGVYDDYAPCWSGVRYLWISSLEVISSLVDIQDSANSNHYSLPGALGMFLLSIGVGKIGETLPNPVYALLSGLNASTVGIIALAAVQVSQEYSTKELD